MTPRYDPDELPFAERDFVYFATYMLRAIMLNETSYNSCILTSKLVSELFRRLGIVTMPLTVGVDALNAAAYERASLGLKIEDFADPEDEAFACRIIHDPTRHTPEGYQGHVAVIVRNRYLVDASIDQLSRPNRNLYIEPLMLTFGEREDETSFEDFIYGESALVELPHGGALFYYPHPEDVEYQNGADWQPLDDRCVGVLESAFGVVEAALDAGAFPPLPALPTSINTHAKDVLEAARAHKLNMEETAEVMMRHGFTVEEYASQLDTVTERIHRHAATG